MTRRNQIIIALTLVIGALLVNFRGCSRNKLEEQGFPETSSISSYESEEEKKAGFETDSLEFDTRPSTVLLTGLPKVRLTTIYKVNLNKRSGTTYIGSNNNLYNDTELAQGNNWNGNLIPGFEGVYGYNLVNISHYDLQRNEKKALFARPVLIKTLYYPSFTNDTLNYKVVKRNFIMVSAYNDDTNKDGYINQQDLRRFYLFDSNGERQNPLVPENYSVFKSEYDSDNDLMYVFARQDKNANGQIEDNEPVNIFWIDLKDPTKTGRQY